jgi:hypothetical protein
VMACRSWISVTGRTNEILCDAQAHSVHRTQRKAGERERETWLCSGATSISHEKGSQIERETGWPGWNVFLASSLVCLMNP